MNHTTDENEDPEERCNCEEKNAVPFLDNLMSIKDGKIEVGLILSSNPYFWTAMVRFPF